MLVYVTTANKIEYAFQHWIGESGNEQRRIVHQVYQWFMASAEAQKFHTITGLISFPLDSWELTFRHWIEREITTHPGQAENIRRWSEQLIALMSSHWGLAHKMIVQECLDEQEVFTLNETQEAMI